MASALVTLAHGAAWYFISHLPHDAQPPAALPVIEVALLPSPPSPLPRPPEPPKAKALPRPRINPQPRPLLPPQPLANRAMEQAAEPARPAPTPPTAPAPLAQAAPEPVMEAPRFNAAYLNNPPPAYPMAARRRGIEGRVLVRAEIQSDGSCSRVELKAGSGSDLLDQAALEAVRKWRFVPARKGSQAVVAWVEVPIAFRLEN